MVTSRTHGRPTACWYPMRRVGAKGSGEFTRISWDEALERIAAGLGDVIAQARRGGDLAVRRHRKHGNDPGHLRRRTPALERAGHVPSCGDDLHDRRWVRHRLHAGRQPRRNGSGDPPAVEARRALGRERAVDESAPVATRSWRLARRARSVVAIDPIRTRTAAAERLAPGPVTGHRRRAGARPAARRAGGRQGGSGVHRPSHSRLGGVSPAHPRVPARARRGHHRHSRGVHRPSRPATGRDPADRHSHRHRPPAPRRRGHGRADDLVHSGRHRRLASRRAVASATTRAASTG